MPYGDLTKQIWQRYETTEDMDKYDCTVEEREEYEPHIRQGNIVYAGVDYEEILRRAEEEVGEEGVIVWDGGNNDLPFYGSDLHVVVADPFRPGHELSSYPGQVNLRLADVVVINKADSAPPKGVRIVKRNTEKVNPHAKIVEASSRVDVDAPKHIESKRVLVIEDGPTLTHGGLSKGAGIVAAEQYGASEIVDPKSSAVGSIKKAYEEYPHIGLALPALGYSEQQIQELAESIRRTESDSVVMATSTDLTNLIDIDRPVVRVSFELQETSSPTLAEIVQEFLGRKLVVQDSTVS
jgi:predicted GTPase